MSRGYERTWFCLPITSLTHISQCNHNLVLSGQGPFIKVEDLSTREVIAQEQGFASQSIHGIRVHEVPTHQGNAKSFLLLIWGGRSIAFVRLSFSSAGPIEGYTRPTLQIGPENEAVDWIIDATFAASEHAPSNIAYAVTAHNAVFGSRAGHPHDLSVRLFPVANGPKSILYSAYVKAISATTLLVAAGTVFGEVILWSCLQDTSGEIEVEGRWRSHIQNVLRGHTGSIFGLYLSGGIERRKNQHQRRLLASCSDDRTIRLWDVSDFDDVAQTELDVSGQPVSATWRSVCQSVEKTSIATTWAHSSRIWGIEWIASGNAFPASPLQLVSRGEDATCQVWEAILGEPNPSSDEVDLGPLDTLLRHVRTDHHHLGKHIWSLAQHLDESDSTIFTGGGDGAIISRTVTAQNAGNCYSSVKTPFCDLLETSKVTVRAGGAVSVNQNQSLKQYIFVSNDAILATTNPGCVIKGAIKSDPKKPDPFLSVRWSFLLEAADLGAFAVMAGDTTARIAYIGSANGNIWIYEHGPQSIQLLTTVHRKISRIFTGSSTAMHEATAVRNLLIISADSLTAMWLQVVHSAREPESYRVSKSVELSLPPKFQATAFLEVSSSNLLILGSRSGAVAIYQVIREHSDTKTITPATCIRHVHGSDTVTCLQHLHTGSNAERDVLSYEILSTGRDGAYAIHKITLPKRESRYPTLITLHRSYPPFGPNIEGANLIMRSPSEIDLILYGFDAKNFVVWNDSTNREVSSVPCGGAHRSWAYLADNSDFVQGESERGGCFVWTKAGNFNLAKFDVPAHKVIQPGGHGREIKAMTLHSGSFRDTNHDHSNAYLLVTGAEDTAIRLWAITTVNRHTHAKVWPDSASCIHVLKKHTTGIQRLAFCRDYLFSSSGFEELFIWKVNFDVSVIGVGAVFQAALPKCAAISDLRITSFEVICLDDNQQSDHALNINHFIVYAAYSNSLVRIFKYTTDDVRGIEDRFHLLAEGYYNTTCLTNLHRLPGSSDYFLTSSTNGAVAVWPIPDSGIGALDPPTPLSHITEHFIHQNAILALRSIRIAPHQYLLLTGGDDNAFGITLILGDEPNSSESFSPSTRQSPPTFATLIIPSAHAAAITALEILDSRIEDSIFTLTAGSASNDQRLKIWRITVHRDKLAGSARHLGTDTNVLGTGAVSAIDVQLLKTMWTSVADLSSMVVVPGVDKGSGAEASEHEEFRVARRKSLMLAGIGMEFFSIDLDDEDT